MNIEVILANYDFSQVETTKSIVWMAVAAVVALVFSVYSYIQMRKMQKKNRPKASQIDGTIADEGVSFFDIAGSPHIHPNITDLWNKKSEAIKQKSGGFLGIGKSSQVTGYRYYTSFAAFIGNRIEKFIAINFDNRGWIVHDPTKHPFNMLPVNKPSLFGQDAGGVVGNIDIEFGFPQPQQNLAYKQHFDLVSAYPYQSYLVFRGNTIDQPFYFGNSNYMKEMLLWVKRTRVRNDGQEQWYEVRGDGAIVCEIGSRAIRQSSTAVQPPDFYSTLYSRYTQYGNERKVDWQTLSNLNANTLTTGGWANASTVSGGGYDSLAEVKIYIPSGIEALATVTVQFTYNRGSRPLLSEIGCQIINIIEVTSEDGLVTETITAEAILTEGSATTIGFLSQLSASQELRQNALVKLHVTVELGEFEQVGGFGIDINPIHKIREILTDDTAMAKPEIDVNDINFRKAADRIWDEGLGVSWAIDEKSCIDAIEELCYHIEAGIRVNRQTGLYEMVLFRDDWFTEDEIHTITENKIKDLSLEVMNGDDIVNQLNVTYYDRERIKNSTFSVYENGSILTMGKANAESIDFPYFMNMRNAEVVANWKLKQYSTPAWKGTFTTGWREARKWNRYDLVEITWSKKWQGTILARIMKIDLGNGLNNEVMIDFEEVVPYSGEMNTSIVVDDSAEEKAEPAKPAIGETFEAPYYIAVQNIGQRKIDEELAHNPDVGFTFSTYRRPQWNALYAEITTANVDKPEDGWIIDGNAEFVTSGQFDQLVSRTATQITVKNLQIEDSLNQGDLIVVGSWIIGNVGQYEFMIIESFDAETSILTVKRGALDTIPFEWGVNTDFWHSKSDDGLFSLTEYSAGQNVRASSLTVTPSSKLEQLGSVPVYMRSRAIRPYPPANVKINGEYWPEDIETDLTITWVDRNRVQQTGGDVLGWFDGGVAIESGTTTHLTLTQYDENQIELASSNANVTGANTFNFSITSMQPDARTVELILKTVRDGYECLNPFVHTVELSQFFSAPYDLTVEFKND